jgi:hypothetical protein
MLTKESAARKDKNSAGCELQHRHSATIAAIIKRMAKVSNQEHGFIDIRDDVADHFADELANTNPRFDRERFLAACRAE